VVAEITRTSVEIYHPPEHTANHFDGPPEDILKALFKTGSVAAMSFAMGVAAARYYDAHRPTAKPVAAASKRSASSGSRA
jgi:hypothetical protein